MVRSAIVASLKVLVSFLITRAAHALHTEAITNNYFGGSNHEIYVDWVLGASSRYHQSLFMPSPEQNNNEDGVAIHWSILDDTTTSKPSRIRLAVAARASGWVGFGLAEAGGMPGSDMVIFETSKPDVVTDCYVLQDYEKPYVDDSSQDWTLIGEAITSGGFLVVEMIRYLNTTDSQDREIDISSSVGQRIIGAWGSAPELSYHGPSNRVRGSVRFAADVEPALDGLDAFHEEMERTSDGSFVVLHDDYVIPHHHHTFYEDVCFDYATLRDLGGFPVSNTNSPWHIVGVEAVIDEDTAPHVHHMLLYGSTDPNHKECAHAGMDLLASWAGDRQPLSLPEEAGFPLGPDIEGGYLSFGIAFHYDNPYLLQGLQDSSGFRLYFSTTIRPSTLGILQTGDPRLGLWGASLPQGLSRHEFVCPSSCTQMFQDDSVTVVFETLHMHDKGQRMTSEVISRDAGEVVHKGSIDYWDFFQTGMYPVRKAYELKKGDSLRTTCYMSNNGEGRFGPNSSDEMCISYIYYYPKQNIPYQTCGFDWLVDACSTEYSSEVVDDLGRRFGIDNGGSKDRGVAIDNGNSDKDGDNGAGIDCTPIPDAKFIKRRKRGNKKSCEWLTLEDKRAERVCAKRKEDPSSAFQICAYLCDQRCSM